MILLLMGAMTTTMAPFPSLRKRQKRAVHSYFERDETDSALEKQMLFERGMPFPTNHKPQQLMHFLSPKAFKSSEAHKDCPPILNLA